MQGYFNALQKRCTKEFEIATAARKKGYDPDDKVEVQLASNMAERVVGLMSVVAPQIVGSGTVERIIELEKQYGSLDWRVALQIALEVAQEKFCKFKDKKEAIEVGVRIGFAYGTVGVVSSPIEGLISIDIKQRKDGKGEYFCLNYGGPVRNAGGTAAAWSVIIGDYVRKKTGYAEYDPDENEIKRCATELEDYHERVTNLQYFPSKQESDFLMKKLPVEVSGDASEDMEVSNYKDLPRIPTNKIRSGYCLIHSSCIPLKAEKLWKQLGKWGNDFDMEHWKFLDDFIKLKKEVHAKGKGADKGKDDKKDKPKITPDFTYIKDLVAGRPVISHPLRNGGFRLRFGRSRTSGFSAQSIHPAAMHAMMNFIATGTQLKVERPGKGAAFTPCDTIEGPIVKMRDGSVYRLDTEKEAREVKKNIAEVLYLGDALVNYGDFLNRNHPLVPPGYCEEWWVQELEKKIVSMFGSLDAYKLSEIVDIKAEEIEKILKNPLTEKPKASQAIRLAKATGTPLHPRHTFFWNSITKNELITLSDWLCQTRIEEDEKGAAKGVLRIDKDQKRNLEIIGVPHTVATDEFVVFAREEITILKEILNIGAETPENAAVKITHMVQDAEIKDNAGIISKLSGILQRDKCGIFIGGRMGRPEKAKMRKLTGSPHTLFPVGDEGGRLRSFQSALEKGVVKAEFSVFKCTQCGKESVLGVCPDCDTKAVRQYFCKECGTMESETCEKHGKNKPFKPMEVEIKRYFEGMLQKMGTKTYPDLIKGVRGTSNKEHIPEHLMKGILRAKYDLAVNKEGTIRYDCSELPITHFKPKELGVSTEKMRELGYTKDIRGRPLENDEQILELKPQDIVIPCCPESPDETSDKVMMRTTQFVDAELEMLYSLPAYYNIRSREDLAGQLVIGLAPHTSAGTLARIIGFSKTQGFFAHPLMHAAMRRDCDGDEGCFILLLDAFLNFSRKYLPESRGSTMDAPLVLTSVLAPAEVDDMAFDVDRAWNYPLEFYEACAEYKAPYEVKIETIKSVLNTEKQYEGMGFTHDTEDINAGVLCSAYKTLPSMQDKLMGQMELAQRIRAVDEEDVARLVIEKHFIRDIRGNLRKFSQQEFRCVNCNEKFRRPPLLGKCTKCGGKILFTISEGSIIKYLEPSISLANKYKLPDYLKQSLEMTKRRIEGVFGKEKDRQTGLGAWFG